MSEGLELVDLEACPNCGFKNDSTAETCGKCGTRFADYDPDEAGVGGPTGKRSSAGSGRRPGQIARQPSPSGSPRSSGGISAGSVAGVIVGLINLVAAGYLFFFYAKVTTNLVAVSDTWISMPAVIWSGVFVFLSMLVAMWRVYEKAGQRGWYILIPIYNTVVMCRMAGRSGWWVLLFLVPLVNWLVQIVIMVGVAQRFGKGVLFGLGLFFLPFAFFPILAFGEATHT